MSSDEVRQALCECFDVIDADKSGHLDSKELHSVLCEFNKTAHCHKKLSEDEINESVKEFIQVLDKDSDNKVSKSEFLDFFVKMYE